MHRGEVVDIDALQNHSKMVILAELQLMCFHGSLKKMAISSVTPLQGLAKCFTHTAYRWINRRSPAKYRRGCKCINYFITSEMGISTGSHTIPELSLPPQEGTHRILHIHKNVPGVLSSINTSLSNNKINILAQYLKTNDESVMLYWMLTKRFQRRLFIIKASKRDY